MRLRSGFVWTVIVVGQAMVVPGQAIGQVQRNGFQFGPTSASVAFDSGLTLGSTSPFGDQLIDVTPTTVTFAKSLRRASLLFSYTPQIEVYGGGSVFNSLDHKAGATFRTPLSRSLNLNASANFLRTNDRSRQTGSLTLVPRGRYIRGGANVGVDYSVNVSTSLGFRLNASLSETALTPTATADESIQQFSNVAGVNFQRSLGRSHSVSANYGHLRTSTEDPRAPGRRTNRSDNVNFGYRFNTRSAFSVGANVGIIRRPGNAGLTHQFSAMASKVWTPLTISGRFARTVAGLLVLDPGNTDPDQIQDPTLINRTVQNASVNVSGEFIRRITLTQNLRWSRVPRAAGEEGFFQNVAGNTNVAIRAGNKVAPFVAISYWLQNTRISTTTTASRFRINAGLRFYWGRLTGAPGGAS